MKLNFGQDFQAEFKSTFWIWSLVDILKLNIEQDFETKVQSRLPKDPGGEYFGQIFVKKCGTYGQKYEGGTVQVEILHRGHSDPALQKSSKKLFAQSPPSWCKYLPNIFIHKNRKLT